MVRSFKDNDIEKVMQIWISGNINAHSFIKKEYWEENFDEVKITLPKSRVLVYEQDGEVQGFIGIMDGYIAGIFVQGNSQSSGIGKKLLDFAKKENNCLSLNVYEKNSRAISFYKREGFYESSKDMDKSTNEMDILMKWESI